MAGIDKVSVNKTIYELVPEIAPLFDNTKAYDVGEYVIKDAALYKFKAAHAAGAWVGTDAETVTVGSEVSCLKANTNYGMKMFTKTNVIYDGSWSSPAVVQSPPGYIKTIKQFTSSSQVAAAVFTLEPTEYIPALKDDSVLKLAIWVETSDENTPVQVTIRLTSGLKWSTEYSVAEGTSTLTKSGVYIVDLKRSHYVVDNDVYKSVVIQFDENKNVITKFGVMSSAENFVNSPLISIPVCFIPKNDPIGIQKNISNFTISNNTISVTSTGGSSYVTLKNINLAVGKKYAIKVDYKPTNADGTLALKVFRSSWKADLASYTQTAETSVRDGFMFTPEGDVYGQIGFDLSNSTGCTHIIQIQIYDVTNVEESIVKAIDFSKISYSGITLNPELFAGKILVPEIAPLFDNTKAYDVGEYVIKDAALYKFKAAHAAGAWVGTDAETVTVGSELVDLKADLMISRDVVFTGWESGSVSSQDGSKTASTTRIRTRLFGTPFPYMIAHTDATERIVIEIYRYNKDLSFDEYRAVYILDNILVGYLFDTDHYYILVSRNITAKIGFTGINEGEEVPVSIGAINDSGVFSSYATNTSTFVPITVDQNKILVAHTPKAITNLFTYKDGAFVRKDRYTDTNNEFAYFALRPGYEYRIYFETGNSKECYYSVEAQPENKLFVGAVYQGNAVTSSGNYRTSMLNANRQKYVSIVCDSDTFVDKYKDGLYIGRVSVLNSAHSPAITDISDCDALYIVTNGLNPVFYSFINSNKLFGKKWCSYGDSITAQQKWQNYIVAKYGLALSNKGVGGSCVTGNTSCTVTPMTDDSRINTIDTDTDIITVMGGTNDFDYCTKIGELSDLQTSFDETTFMGSVAIIVKKLQTRCPNAKIILMSNVNSRGITGENSDRQQVSSYGFTPYDFAMAMKECAEWLSVDFIDVWACGINQMNRATYVSDTVHPNDEGGRLIANKVLSYFSTLDV